MPLHLDCHGAECGAVYRGRQAFSDRNLHGLDANGRACADCHMPTEHFQLTPAAVEQRFQQLAAARERHEDVDDPLFRPIDADDFIANGTLASDYRNLREHALIRITLPLPPTMRLVDPSSGQLSAETTVDVFRMVPSVNDVAITGPDGMNPWARGPNPFGGYQLDGRVGTLEEQALGAFTNHAQTQSPPGEGILADLAQFQRALFSNPRVKALADAMAAGTTPLPDADRPLNELEQQGKTVFVRACGQCHGGPGLSTPQAPVPHYHDIATQCPRPVDTQATPRFQFAPCDPGLMRNVRTYEIRLINGTTQRRTSSDPGRALLTGFVGGPPVADDWNKFDVPGLRGIGTTAPYFHNNSANTLEEVVDHYTEFFKRVRANTAPAIAPVLSTDGINIDRPHTPAERDALLAYLKTL
jgi:cytochrome c peroxidase